MAYGNFDLEKTNSLPEQNTFSEIHLAAYTKANKLPIVCTTGVGAEGDSTHETPKIIMCRQHNGKWIQYHPAPTICKPFNGGAECTDSHGV